MSQSQIEKQKLKEWLRKYREKRKLKAQQCNTRESNQLATGTPYCTSQSLGRALKCARVSLPSSPHKKRCVIENLAKRVGLETVNSSLAQRGSGLSEGTKHAVNAFIQQ